MIDEILADLIAKRGDTWPQFAVLRLCQLWVRGDNRIEQPPVTMTEQAEFHALRVWIEEAIREKVRA